MTVKPCRCGATRDTRGLCPHCDRRASELCSKRRCVNCATRDTYCTVCRRSCGTPAGASACEATCRGDEIRRKA